MRNAGLDLLRLLAVLLVLFRHLQIPEELHATAAGGLLAVLRRGGWVGVDLFFVLSGYLVSALLFKEYLRDGRIDIGRFLIRRGMKIYPAFWLFLALTLPVIIWQGHSPSILNVLSELLFTQNYFQGVWGHTWSLAVEEHFYIGLALLFGLALRLSPQGGLHIVPCLFAILALICLTLRGHAVAARWPFDAAVHYLPTHLRVDSLFAGVALSYATHFRDLGIRAKKVPALLLVSFGFLCLVPAFVWSQYEARWLHTIGYLIFSFGGVCLVMAFTRLVHVTSPTLRALTALGAASYPIYLWHVVVPTWGLLAAKKLLPLEGYAWTFVFAIPGSLIFGWLMAHLTEKPVLRIRDRFFPSHLATATARRDLPRTPKQLPRLLQWRESK